MHARSCPGPPGARADRAAYRDAESPGRGTGTRRSCALQFYRGFPPRVAGQRGSVRRAQQYPPATDVLVQRHCPCRHFELSVDACWQPVEIIRHLTCLLEGPGLRRPDEHVEVAVDTRRGNACGQLEADAAGRAPGEAEGCTQLIDRVQDAQTA